MYSADDMINAAKAIPKVAEYLEDKEMVNSPKHYNTGNIEVIDAIEDWGMNFSEGNAIKYIARAKYKGRFEEDIKKAIWYLERMLEKC